MGVIWAKFRKEKSTQEVLEKLQEKIDTLETFTVDTQEQKKRFVGNFLAVSIGVYVIAFVIFYFVYFPPTWSERFMYFLPLLVFPIIIIFLRYLFTWYFQRKLNKNSKKLTALRAEKKKILEQVMDKETYKVAVNLLARYADKPSRSSYAISSTPSKHNQPLLNRSFPLQSATLSQRSNQLALTSTTPARGSNSSIENAIISSNTSHLSSHHGTPRSTAMVAQSNVNNQQLRRRTAFPVIDQRDKGVFDRIVDVLIGDGPQDRFAMVCKECFAHNGMALKEDFEYTTYRCAFCGTLNPSRKQKPVAPRLSVLPPAPNAVGSDTSDSDDDKDDSDDEPSRNLSANTTNFSTPSNTLAAAAVNDQEKLTATSSTSSSDDEDEAKKHRESKLIETINQNELQTEELIKENESNSDKIKIDKALEELLKTLEKSDSAIEDTAMSSE